MRSQSHVQGKALFAVVFALVLTGFAATLAAAPVTVTVAVSGTPAPGAALSAKANIAITDGSQITSINWKQSAGIPVTLSGANTDTVSFTLPALAAYKKQMIEVLEEAPITDASKWPSYVPKPANYEGLQNRFMLTGITPHALTDAGATGLTLTVVTTTGTYTGTASIAANLPWATTNSQRNVPLGLPVLLHGKKQASYDWKLTAAPGASATLKDATTQDPEFTPDGAGTYTVTVTDLALGKPVTLTIHAGVFRGVITGIEADGHPKVDTACTSCHVKGTPTFDQFTPWARSGHAEIFTQNINDPAGHWTTNCISCHSVGAAPNATTKNNGLREQSDWSAFVGSDIIKVGHGAVGNWSKLVSTYPASSRYMNIQCENCHGPNDANGHMKQDGSRSSLASEMCGSCHGEPARHGRFQQWQLSGHANYEVAQAEGTNAGCAKCHSAQGFVQWAQNGFSTKAITVDWSADEVHPVTCQTCHDPHDVGTDSASGKPTNATTRVMNNTPMLDAGFQAKNVGSAAICMTCHNGRRGLRDDQHVSTDLYRAPHEGPQADILLGYNLYFVKVGEAGMHGKVEDSCVACHMEKTAQPSTLSVAGSGTNHTFYADPGVCSKCHSQIKAADVQEEVEAKLVTLKGNIETALKSAMQAQIRAGNQIDLNKLKTIKSANEIKSVEFISSHGAQGVNVKFADGSSVNDLSLATVSVVRPAGPAVPLLNTIDSSLGKAGWNYFMVEADKSKGVHNPGFVNSALDVSNFAVTTLNAAITSASGSGSIVPPALGGGMGNGAGAVSCSTPYVYWAEIAGHMPGNAGSQWRTDLVARNLGTSTAALKFVLHQATGGNLEGTGTINGFSQRAFEDVVATLGGPNNMGSLEICSDQPLLVLGRIFSQGTTGTFGQNLDGRVADLGYSAGQTLSLIGLRQKTDAYRTNISVTNGGKTDAQVTVNLFDATGKSVKTYDLTVPAGQVVQDTAPFASRAGLPDVDWGFATVTVVKGTNIISSASMIDMKTNDPTTIPAKQ